MPLWRRRPARWSTSSGETVADHPEALAIDNGAEMLTYEEFAEAADELAAALNAVGVGRGDRVGVRIRSGTVDLYVAIMGVLVAGAAYVPVDADDPDERARLVFGEADVAAVVGNGPGRSPTAACTAALEERRGPGARRTTRGSSSRPGSTGYAEGRRGLAPVGGGVRRRRVADVPPGARRSATPTG